MDTIDGLGGKNGYGNTVVNNRGTTSSTANQNNAVSTDTATEDSSVNLSAGAANMKALTQSLAAEPSFDQAKVDRIKALIAEGQYTIDPTKIAAKFASLEGPQG